ncbi:MAG: hypothetical protein HKN26_06720, partial [Acidimicrobiales bacterium]|nr:hypothetical protein [Acidimicrobiales bacterium]
VLGYETNADNLGFADNNGYGDVVVRPTFVPTVNSATGSWNVGETSEITILGDFSLDSQVFFTGDGITATTVTAVTEEKVVVDVTTAPTATPGLRTFYVISPAPQLGLPPVIGAADDGIFLLQP